MDVAGPVGLRSWHETIREALKQNDVRLATYVPDNVLSPLINGLHADSHFTTFCCTREEEAVGIATGAWMGGMLGVVLMQTSGFATLAERARLARRALSDPAHHDHLRARHARRIQSRPGDGLPHHAPCPAIHGHRAPHDHAASTRSSSSSTGPSSRRVSTQAPAALILNPLLTGGKVEKKER